MPRIGSGGVGEDACRGTGPSTAFPWRGNSLVSEGLGLQLLLLLLCRLGLFERIARAGLSSAQGVTSQSPPVEFLPVCVSPKSSTSLCLSWFRWILCSTAGVNLPHLVYIYIQSSKPSLSMAWITERDGKDWEMGPFTSFYHFYRNKPRILLDYVVLLLLHCVVIRSVIHVPGMYDLKVQS